MWKSKLIEVTAYLLVFLFVYTALSKWFTYDIYLYDLTRSPELGRFALPISILIPGSELLAAVLLIMPSKRKWGFMLSLLLMTMFTLYVAYVLIFAESLPCTCGGIIRDLTWPQHLVFNIFFTFLAALGVLYYKRNDFTSRSSVGSAALK